MLIIWSGMQKKRDDDADKMLEYRKVMTVNKVRNEYAFEDQEKVGFKTNEPLK